MEGEKERGRRGETDGESERGRAGEGSVCKYLQSLFFFFFALLDSIPGMSPFHDFFVLTKMDADLDGDREWMEI